MVTRMDYPVQLVLGPAKQDFTVVRPQHHRDRAAVHLWEMITLKITIVFKALADKWSDRAAGVHLRQLILDFAPE